MSLRKFEFVVVAIVLLCCATAVMAQVKTQTSQIPGQVSTEVQVERGEVIYVSGNDFVVKMENGEIRHFTAPDDAKATVDGKEITVKDLKPGMKLQRTITKTSEQQTVKTIKTGTGTVINVMPPLSVTLRFEDNSVQSFKIPKDQIFMVGGEKKTAFDLKKGMKITATRVTLEPVNVMSTTSRVTGSAAPPPTPELQGALLIAEATPPRPAPAPTVAAAEPTPAPTPEPEKPAQKLPKTGSLVPLIGLFGVLFTGTSLAIRRLRRS